MANNPQIEFITSNTQNLYGDSSENDCVTIEFRITNTTNYSNYVYGCIISGYYYDDDEYPVGDFWGMYGEFDNNGHGFVYVDSKLIGSDHAVLITINLYEKLSENNINKIFSHGLTFYIYSPYNFELRYNGPFFYNNALNLHVWIDEAENIKETGYFYYKNNNSNESFHLIEQGNGDRWFERDIIDNRPGIYEIKVGAVHSESNEIIYKNILVDCTFTTLPAPIINIQSSSGSTVTISCRPTGTFNEDLHGKKFIIGYNTTNSGTPIGQVEKLWDSNVTHTFYNLTNNTNYYFAAKAISEISGYDSNWAWSGKITISNKPQVTSGAPITKAQMDALKTYLGNGNTVTVGNQITAADGATYKAGPTAGTLITAAWYNS